MKKRKGTKRKLGSESEEDEERPTKNCPGISYWIMVNVLPHAMVEVEIKICKILLESGLNIFSCNVIRARGIIFLDGIH